MKNSKSDDWRLRDRAVLWHPFTQHALWESEDFPVIESGEGVYLFDLEGRKYLDGVSSLWLNVHGHRKPEIDAAIKDQLGRVAHSTFLGLSHRPGIRLAERLIEIAPPGLARVFFSDDGSTAMEIALKMAYQFWRQAEPDSPERTIFIRFTNAYHGDTIGSVSLGGIEAFHAAYRPLLFPAVSAPAPYCRRCPLKEAMRECTAGSGCLAELDRLLSEHGERVAGVVIEPRVQGAAGMVIQPAGFIRRVRELCDQYHVLMIADEVATGFGRTGYMFACDSEETSPDLMAVGKGLSGGYLPIAATLAREEIFEAFLGPRHHTRTFFHGHSYTANPLAAAAANASLELFEKEKTLDNVRARTVEAAAWLERLQGMAHVGETRAAGLMIGIELEEDPNSALPYDPDRMMGRKAVQAARKRGLILRPLSDVVILMPPLCVSRDELAMMMKITREAIREATEGEG